MISIAYTLQDVAALCRANNGPPPPSERAVAVIQSLVQQLGLRVQPPILPHSFYKPPLAQQAASTYSTTTSTAKRPHPSSKRSHRAQEITNDAEWESIRSFQATPMREEKTGVDLLLDGVRIQLNKLTDKNYLDVVAQIKGMLEGRSEEEMRLMCTLILEIASTNRFYSKVYAELFAELTSSFAPMATMFQAAFAQYTESFHQIRHVSPDEDYNLFCEINGENERRRALAAFYVNLMHQGILSAHQLVVIAHQLVQRLYQHANTDGCRPEVDEHTEVVVLLLQPEWLRGKLSDETLLYLRDTITELATRPVKSWKSMTTKSMFKLADLLKATTAV